MERQMLSNIKLENAKLIRKNFRGERKEFNEEGNRNFGVIIDDELAEKLLMDGWNVKRLRPRPDDPDQIAPAWLPVKVKFGRIPPIVVLITSKGKMCLDEETIGQLDWTRMKAVDLIIRPYEYVKGTRSGVSAYLKSMYVTVDEADDLAYKYIDIPEID